MKRIDLYILFALAISFAMTVVMLFALEMFAEQFELVCGAGQSL